MIQPMSKSDFKQIESERDEFHGQVYNQGVRDCDLITDNEPPIYTAPIKEVFDFVVQKLGAEVIADGVAIFNNTYIFYNL